MSPTSSAGGTVTARSVRNRIPDPVLTTLPLGIVVRAGRVEVVEAHAPGRLRLLDPLAGRREGVARLDVDREQLGRHDRGRGLRIRRRGGGAGHDPQRLGPMVPSRGAITAVAVGRYRNAAAPPTTTASATTASADDERRPTDRRAERPTDRLRPERRRDGPLRWPGCLPRRALPGSRRAPDRPASVLPGRRGRPRSSAGRRGRCRVDGACCHPGARGRGAGGRRTSRGRTGGRPTGGRRPGDAADAANAPAAAAAPAPGRSLPDARPFGCGVATVSLTRIPSASSSSPIGAAASGPASPVATPEAAAAAKAPASASVPERSSSNEDSYSPTVAKIGRPADAASARVAPSPATIESRLPLVSASRARRRKLMREVATREPYGSTTATRLPSADRMRAAAEVISSSMSR